MIQNSDLWFVIIALGAGSFAMRFAFLGLIGDRPLPEWLLRHLRYTAVAILPALVAPLVVWPSATGGQTDPLRLAAAGAAFLVGYFFKSLIGAMIAGAVVLIAGGQVLG
ncbi:AzlD domain-containing protein [Thalassococcus lentus]|uniref:AzlD domain-containing protein n=1 Tax=Thalassococcus lentus TaxID=1210524 RepID=A0ABT4XSR9_9RHOB|nr:AzlD domain-containing protein [Thalassococcus lentus]MDA7424975.1 AzlD domain-containing protein [Thalassococcus lentus]